MIRLLIILLFGGYCQKIYGQNEQMFTQYMFNKMAINPAFAGNENYTGITVHVREQWNGFPGAPEAQLLSANLPRFNKNVGAGINLRRRTIGIHSEITVSGIYSYKFLFDEGTLSLGIEPSFRNRISDFADTRLIASQGKDIDPSIPATSLSKNSFNTGFGIYFNNKNYFLGASVPRLIKNSIDFDDNEIKSLETRHLFIMGGASFTLTDNIKLLAQSLLKFAEASPFDADITTSLMLQDKYTFGLGYRTGGGQGNIGESIAALLSFQIADRFMIGFSQDFTLSDIRSYDNGSFEVIATYALGKKSSNTILLNPRYF